MRYHFLAVALILLLPLPALADDEGKLLVECNVQASVKLNGITIGETGETLIELPEGKVTVTVSATGYEDYEEKVTLEAGRLVKLEVTLKRKEGADVPDKPEPEPDKTKKPEPPDRDKELGKVKQRYTKSQRTRKALICKTCKGRTEVYCKYCKGSGKERVLSGRGGMMTIRCRTCTGKGKWPCKKCKATGRDLGKIKILFWDMLDPEYKERMDITANKDSAIDMGIATSKGKKGFKLTLDSKLLTKKFNVVKELEYRLDDKCEYAAVTWECNIKGESWSEGIVLRRMGKVWYWVPDKSPGDVKETSKQENKGTRKQGKKETGK